MLEITTPFLWTSQFRFIHYPNNTADFDAAWLKQTGLKVNYGKKSNRS